MRATFFITIASLAVVQGLLGDHENVKREFAERSVCGDTTWVRETSTIAAKIDDCMELRGYLLKAQYDGFQIYGLNGTHQGNNRFNFLAGNSTCNFGYRVLDAKNAPAYIANGDITDILGDAVTKFGSNGRVGASGVMDCSLPTDPNDAQKINWRIFSYDELCKETGVCWELDT